MTANTNKIQRKNRSELLTTSITYDRIYVIETGTRTTVAEVVAPA